MLPTKATSPPLQPLQTNGTPANGDCGLTAFPVSMPAKETIAAVSRGGPPGDSTMFAKIQIDPAGKVTHLRVLRLAYPQLPNATVLNEQAIDTIKHWSYAPTKIAGRPVAVCSDVTVTIDLSSQ